MLQGLTLVMRPCMMRKCGLLTFKETEWNRFWTRLHATVPLIILGLYLCRPSELMMSIWYQEQISAAFKRVMCF